MKIDKNPHNFVKMQANSLHELWLKPNTKSSVRAIFASSPKLEEVEGAEARRWFVVCVNNRKVNAPGRENAFYAKQHRVKQKLNKRLGMGD